MATFYDNWHRGSAYLDMVRGYCDGVVIHFQAWSGVWVTTNEWSSHKIKYAKQRKVFVE